MAEKTNQSFANHVKLVPTFHFFVLPALTLNLVQSIYRLVHTGFRWDALVAVLTAAALLLLAFHARLFALRVQDRVIRLEERMRLERLLPEDLRPRIGRLSTGAARCVTICMRCGVTRVGPQGAQRQADRPDHDKEDGANLACRLSPRLIACLPLRLVILKHASRDPGSDFRPTKYSAPRPPRRAPALR